MKPIDVTLLVEIIRQRVANGPLRAREIEDVAAIVERMAHITIAEWLERVQTDEELMSIPMSCELRCGHLPLFFCELNSRLRLSEPMGGKDLISAGAAKHGFDRFQSIRFERVVDAVEDFAAWVRLREPLRPDK